ncbi:hypothetical protein [Streptomyces rubradiris]|nr:hypothetical protein [Streptomyces rubradiris]
MVAEESLRAAHDPFTLRSAKAQVDAAIEQVRAAAVLNPGQVQVLAEV